MNAHLNFLGALYIVWGAVSALIGLATLALGVAAAALSGVAHGAAGRGMAADVTAAIFLLLALLSLLWGATHIVAGLALRRRRHWARSACLALAIINLILLPYGTALGIYGLWVLLNDEIRQQFQPVLV